MRTAEDIERALAKVGTAERAAGSKRYLKSGMRHRGASVPVLSQIRPLKAGAGFDRFAGWADAMLEEREFFIGVDVGEQGDRGDREQGAQRHPSPAPRPSLRPQRRGSPVRADAPCYYGFAAFCFVLATSLSLTAAAPFSLAVAAALAARAPVFFLRPALGSSRRAIS